MISPVAGNRIRSHLSSVSVLAELGVRFSLQLDDVAALAVLHAENLDVDGASPVVPAGVLFAVDVDIRCAILISETKLGLLVLLHAVEGLAFLGGDLVILRLGVDDCWCHCDCFYAYGMKEKG